MYDRDGRTEEATPKKLRDAKKKGQVTKSNDLNSAALLLVFAISSGVFAQYTYNHCMKNLKHSLSLDFYDLSSRNAGILLKEGLFQFFSVILPIALLAVVVAIVINLIQTRFVFSAQPLKPDFKKLNPIAGFKNIFSGKAIFNLIKNLFKLVIVIGITYNTLSNIIKKIINTPLIGSEKSFFFVLEIIKDLSINISVVMIILGIIDYIFQRREFKKKLRMTKQEVKDEYKETEGDPQIKSARQQKQRQLAMSRMMSEIPTSDVVITNPTHIAVVLRYDTEKDKAPILTAKGIDFLAEKIKSIANENDIPIIENKPLARTIYKKIDIGNFIPVELYQAIAEILAVVYQMQQRNKGRI